MSFLYEIQDKFSKEMDTAKISGLTVVFPAIHDACASTTIPLSNELGAGMPHFGSIGAPTHHSSRRHGLGFRQPFVA